MNWYKKIILYLFGGLLFLTPLILWPFTSEVFEFNKVVVTYIFTVLICAFWTARMVYERKIIVSRTLLDIPLLFFLVTQFISTLISIDPNTSMFGYYSRFNGGFLSTLCYSLLYWAYVSNFELKETVKLIKVILVSAALVSIYGVLEHFGIDKDIWVQDVKSRVFSTLGQPNWLASWLVAITPPAIYLALNSRGKSSKLFWVNFSLAILFFWTLIFTKSRSGFLGIAFAIAIYFALTLLTSNKEKVKSFFNGIVLIGSAFLAICIISGTQWTPSLNQLLNQKVQTKQPVVGPALEVGGTESGVIRKIVWKGAIDIIKAYPVFGTGVETFAYSYYKFRPQEHNLVSEWDFVYNKAHNQYLNIAANSGILGLIGYIAFIIVAVIQMYKNRDYAPPAIAGFASLLVTNFFGFSVMPTDLLFFLFPAFVFSLSKSDEEKFKNVPTVSNEQKVAFAALGFFSLYLIILICRYWYADVNYAKAKDFNARKRPDLSLAYISKAVSISPNQALYRNELSGTYTSLALNEYSFQNASKAAELAKLAVTESEKAVELSPSNINIKRNRFGMFVMLSQINQNFITDAGQTLIETINLAPTDAKLYYNLALFYIQIGKNDMADQTFKKTIDLKANYKEARLAYAVFLIDKQNIKEAKAQLEYILKYIDPLDTLTKQTLESIK